MQTLLLYLLILTASLLTAATSNPVNAQVVGDKSALSSMPPLIRLVAEGKIDQVKAEIERHPGNVDVRGEGGMTPLLVSIVLGNADARELLLRSKANPALADNDNRTPLILAAFRGDNEAIQSLTRFESVRKNVDAQMKPVGATALHLAMANNNPEGVRLLIAAGANPNVADASGDAPRWFCQKENTEACRFLPK